jgi:hypothetical protein
MIDQIQETYLNWYDSSKVESKRLSANYIGKAGLLILLVNYIRQLWMQKALKKK